MHKILTSFILLCAVFSLNAAVVTFDFENNEFNLPTTTVNTSHDGDVTAPITKDGITLTPTVGSATMGPLMYYSDYNKTIDLRFYKGSSFTISSVNGAPITSIDFTTTSKFNVVADSGDWTGDVYTNWIGNSAAVVFTVNGSSQIKKFVVTTDDASTSCAMPTFSPTHTELYEPTLISLDCKTEGADIFYTTDGSTPSNGSNKYSAPFEISATTTVNAIAVKGSAVSPVASITYEFPEFTSVADIAAFIAAKPEGPAKIASQLIVIHQSKKYLQVKDNSGYIQVYGDLGKTFSIGDVIPAGVVGSYHEQNNSIQLLPVATTIKDASTTTDVSPIEVSVSNFTPEFQNTYVVCRGVQLSRTKVGNYYNYSITDATGTLPLYQRFEEITFPTEEGSYDVTGVASYYNGNVQLYPTKFVKVGSGVDGIGSDRAQVVAHDGCISVIGNAQSIAVYSASGVCISTDALTAHCMPGLYVVIVNGIAHKVIIK